MKAANMTGPSFGKTRFDHHTFMDRCLFLAAGGQGHVSPNPLVGAVIVHKGKVIGEGFHRKAGSNHAEVEALNRVEEREYLKESTLYVSLEPCSHHGKTPPCTDAIITSGIRHVVMGMKDPDYRVNGKGVALLEAAGIKVDAGVMEAACQEQNRPFIISTTLKRPYILLKWAESADGYIADDHYQSKWLSNAWSRQRVHQWRSMYDAVMTGTHTALHDNPELSIRDWVKRPVTRIFTDRNGRVTTDYKLMDGTMPTIMFTNQNREISGLTTLAAGDDPARSPGIMLEQLYKQGIRSVMIEGGSTLIQSFINQNLWDDARVFETPKVLKSGIRAPILNGTLVSIEKIDSDHLRHLKNTASSQ